MLAIGEKKRWSHEPKHALQMTLDVPSMAAGAFWSSHAWARSRVITFCILSREGVAVRNGADGAVVAAQEVLRAGVVLKRRRHGQSELRDDVVGSTGASFRSIDLVRSLSPRLRVSRARVRMMASTAAAQVRVRAGRRGVDVVRISRPPAVDAKETQTP